MIHPRELARAITSLTDSTAITVLHGPSRLRLVIIGRNGSRPAMTTAGFNPADGHKKAVCLDNGKFRMTVNGPDGVDYPGVFLTTLDLELARHAIPLSLRRENCVRIAVERCKDREGNATPRAGEAEVVILPVTNALAESLPFTDALIEAARVADACDTDLLKWAREKPRTLAELAAHNPDWAVWVTMYVPTLTDAERDELYALTGTRAWWRNGKLHREDGPAREWGDGEREWWRDGKRHREDGPAIEGADGARESRMGI